MTIKNTLTSIVVAGTLALGTTGCKDYSSYKYNGLIGQDSVKFEISYQDIVNTNTMTVKKPSGIIVSYIDKYHDDLKLEYVEITKDGIKKGYSSHDAIGKPIVAEGQKQFDNYLPQILEIKINEGLNNLK
jgi:predicted component of type VI protein secretion system